MLNLNQVSGAVTRPYITTATPVTNNQNPAMGQQPLAENHCCCDSSGGNSLNGSIVNVLTRVIDFVLSRFGIGQSLSTPQLSFASPQTEVEKPSSGLSGLISGGLGTLGGFLAGGPIGGALGAVQSFGGKIVDKVGGLFKKIF